MLDVAVYQMSATMLKPVRDTAKARLSAVNLAPGSYSSGQLLGQITSAANDVQTVTVTGSPTGGTFTLKLEYPIGNIQTTASIAHNASAATVQTALAALSNVGSGNVAVTGSGGGPWTVTFQGALASRPIPVMTLGTNALTGGSSPSVTIAHTTTGVTGGEYAKYDASVVSVPAAPTPSGTGSGSAFAAGTHLVQVTAVNAQGETTPSIATAVTLTAAQQIRIAAMSSLGASVTSLKVYVDGVLIGSCAVSGGTSTQTDFTGSSLAVAGQPPQTNTAYTIPNGAGTQTAVAILAIDAQVDNAGQITGSNNSSQLTGGLWGEKYLTAPAYYGGEFNVADLTGLTALAVEQLQGHFAIGGLSGGVFVF